MKWDLAPRMGTPADGQAHVWCLHVGIQEILLRMVRQASKLHLREVSWQAPKHHLLEEWMEAFVRTIL